MRLSKHIENRGPGESQSPDRTESPLSFTSGGQSIGASASVLPVNIQGWFPLGLTGWISLLAKELSRVLSSTTLREDQFFSAQLSLWSNSPTLKMIPRTSPVQWFRLQPSNSRGAGSILGRGTKTTHVTQHDQENIKIK